MNCRDFKEVRFLFIDADLAQETRIAFQKHWEHCPECARMAQLTQQVLQLVRSRCCREAAPVKLRDRIHWALNGDQVPEDERH
ncbi:MAG: mycothiol system anti-sigma-R factor [Thermoanaerobaculia bacterium]